MTDTPNFTPNTGQVESLYDEMVRRGMLASSSKTILVNNLNANSVQACYGTTTGIGTENPVKVVLVIDMSGSMYTVKQELIDDLKKLIGTDFVQIQDDTGVAILVAVIVFNDGVRALIPFTPVDRIDLTQIDSYSPTGSTALNDGTMWGIQGSAGFGYELFKKGIRGGMNILAVLTDGGENASTLVRNPRDIATVMDDLRKRRKNVFAFFGFGDDSYFRPIAQTMGFKDTNIITLTGATLNALKKALEMISSSVSHHSQAVSLGKSATSSSGDNDVLFVS